MGNAKIQIDLAQGKLEVEGDADLVREIYADFKDQISKQKLAREQEAPPQEASAKAPKKRTAPKRKQRTSTDENGIDPDHPKLDKSLDLSGLQDFYAQYVPKNNAEKVLLFAHFLIEEKGIETPNTDQFFTCYATLKERIPKAFSQTFRDAGGKSYGYIDYKSASEITLTHLGMNHLNDESNGIKRAGS